MLEWPASCSTESEIAHGWGERLGVHVGEADQGVHTIAERQMKRREAINLCAIHKVINVRLRGCLWARQRVFSSC